MASWATVSGLAFRHDDVVFVSDIKIVGSINFGEGVAVVVEVIDLEAPCLAILRNVDVLHHLDIGAQFNHLEADLKTGRF